MTIDEAVTYFREALDKVDPAVHTEFRVFPQEVEQLLYWLTEYRSMISCRHSDNLSERLAEHLVWAESNSYECPVTLAEDLQEAISVIAAANKVIESHDSKVAELEAVIYGMDGEINRLQSASSWIPCEERMPEDWKDVLVCFSGSDDVMIANHLDYWQESRECIPLNNVTHWMPLPKLPEKPKKEDEQNG